MFKPRPGYVCLGCSKKKGWRGPWSVVKFLRSGDPDVMILSSHVETHCAETELYLGLYRLTAAPVLTDDQTYTI
jgi:hypothetical protein